MELTRELIIKHEKQIIPILETEVQVKASTRVSKTGKMFAVRAHSRNMTVEHEGHKFKLRADLHPRAQVQQLRKMAQKALAKNSPEGNARAKAATNLMLKMNKEHNLGYPTPR